MEYTIRNIKLNEFINIYNRIEQDFTSGEYAPYDILYKQLQDGVQKGLILLEGESEVAYSICTQGDTSEYVLVSLLAVYEEFRGRGFGSAFLGQLKKIYSDKKGIIVEVEKPKKAVTKEEKILREKRIQFYQKAGFYLIPDIDYSIWDVPMHLMVLPLKAPNWIVNKEIGQIICEIYLTLLGKHSIHKCKFEKLKTKIIP